MKLIMRTVFTLVICLFLSSCGSRTESETFLNSASMGSSDLEFAGTVFLKTGAFVEQKGVLPDKNSKEFYIFQETRLKDVKTLNHLVLSEGARSIKIVGLKIELGEKLPSQLYESLHNKEDIKRLEIDAETIVVKNSLYIPQADLIIRAKSLIFENDAKIDTSAKPFPIPAALLQNGNDGLNGGNFEIYVEKIIVPSNQTSVTSN